MILEIPSSRLRSSPSNPRIGVWAISDLNGKQIDRMGFPAINTALIPPVVTLGNTTLNMTFAGLAPGQIGVYQITATVPKGGVAEGMPIPLVIKQGGSATQIDVRVVK